jgi:putative NADH-flavin reductase
MNENPVDQPLRVIVFGAGGKLGWRLVAAGLSEGHAVSAFVRDAEKLRQQLGEEAYGRLRVEVGDALDAEAVGRALAGHGAVVNAAGMVGDGERFVQICANVVHQAERRLAPPRRRWLLGGAAALTIPQTDVLGVDLPGMPKMYRNHKTNHELLRKSTLDWSFMCPGPMVEGDAPTPRLRISTEILSVQVGGWVRWAPRPALTLVMARHLPEMIVSYEDVARLVMANLDGDGPYAHKRVGVALPLGQKGRKPGWRRGQVSRT